MKIQPQRQKSATKALFFFSNFLCKYLTNIYKYLGAGPDAFFYIGKFGTNIGHTEGIKVPYPENSEVKLPKYNGQTLTLKLPNGIKSSEIGWLSVWCVAYSVNFGDLMFSKNDDNTVDVEPNAEGENDTIEISNNSVNIEPSAEGENEASEKCFGSKILIGLMLVYLVLPQIIF